METAFHATTIVAVSKDGKTAIAGDGQVTMGNSVIMKGTAQKVRRLYNGKVVSGFAGSVADAFSLFDRFEAKLNEYNGNLIRSAVELAKSDGERILMLSGTGEVIEPDDGISAIGSGGMYALAAARALKDNTDLTAKEIAEKSLHIAADICVYTNHNVICEEI